LYYSLKKKNFLNINKKYIIYFLQKQPEASSDVKGIYYSDHLKNIQNIWRVLPNNFQLIIKEHPNCIGDRSLSFYKSFLKLPNIFLSDNKYENKLLKSAIATISVASTASLKTALLQIPSFTFAETFFNCLDFSARISLDEMRNCKNFFELLNKKFLNKKSNNINFYLENSFEGTIIPEKLNDKNNLNKIRKALIEVVNK
jgi:capsule polysaccharide modification protein KpsS